MANNLVNGETFEFVSGATKADFDALKAAFDTVEEFETQTFEIIPLELNYNDWQEYPQGAGYTDNKVVIEKSLIRQINLAGKSQLRLTVYVYGYNDSATSGRSSDLSIAVSDGNRSEEIVFIHPTFSANTYDDGDAFQNVKIETVTKIVKIESGIHTGDPALGATTIVSSGWIRGTNGVASVNAYAVTSRPRTAYRLPSISKIKVELANMDVTAKKIGGITVTLSAIK